MTRSCASWDWWVGVKTAACSRCYMHFRLRGGLLRRHDDMQGNRCPGIGLSPWVPISKPWMPWAREVAV